MKRTPLHRGAGLRQRTPMPHRHAPMRQRATPKPGESAAERAGRRALWRRSKGICEIQIPGICVGQATEWHHRRNRSQQGLWLPCNGLHLCWRCHGAVTNTNGNRAEYEHLGWIVPGWRDPASKRVWYRQQRWVRLDNTSDSPRDAPTETREEGPCPTTT